MTYGSEGFHYPCRIWDNKYNIANPELSAKDVDRQSLEDYKKNDIAKKFILRR